MDHNTDSQGEESSYQEQSYYDGLDGSLQDQDAEYQTGELEQRSPLREQDRFLPIANVAKIMKRAVPVNGKIAKEAKECVQECVSEFISFITSEAAEKCQTEKRKTINGEDILSAMNILGFDNYIEPLRTFLVKFRELSKLESSYLDDTPVAVNSITSVPSAPGSTVILTPALLTANGTNLATVSTRTLAGRQFAVFNGSEELSSASVQTVGNTEGKTSTLGTPVSTSLGTAIILPISTPLTFVTGANSVSIADRSTDTAS